MEGREQKINSGHKTTSRKNSVRIKGRSKNKRMKVRF